MTRSSRWATPGLLLALLMASCGGGGNEGTAPSVTAPAATHPASARVFGTRLDPARPANYSEQQVPAYVTRDLGRPESDAVAALGRVLFYDRALSIDGSVSCASCHQQRAAFGDPALASAGVAGGRTARHSMRLVNARFGAEPRCFWDERAATLEQQTTRPIQDHGEMGFSGEEGRPGLADLLARLQALDYIGELMVVAFGDGAVTEARLQRALGAFVRSIQSFDSRYDAGRAGAVDDGQPFANFSAQENQGKQLFLTRPQFDAAGVRVGGGLGCGGAIDRPSSRSIRTRATTALSAPSQATGATSTSRARQPCETSWTRAASRTVR